MVGIVGGGEASAAAHPATGGRSMWHDRRCFGRLEQQDERLKKHYGRKNKITARAAGSLLSSSPCTVISFFLSVVDHIDNTGGRRRGERTKAEYDGEASDGNEHEPGKITASRGRRSRRSRRHWFCFGGSRKKRLKKCDRR